jgi:hypothetical protein
MMRKFGKLTWQQQGHSIVNFSLLKLSSKIASKTPARQFELKRLTNQFFFWKLLTSIFTPVDITKLKKEQIFKR